mgnify:CR=1 FL=1
MTHIKRHWPAFALALIFSLALAPIAFAHEAASNTEAVNGVPTNMIMWSSVVGFFLPLAIAIPKRQRWASWVKGVFAFGCCLVAAAGTAYFSGDLSKISDYVTAALFVVFTALGSYKLLWQPSGIAPGIEEKTG